MKTKQKKDRKTSPRGNSVCKHPGVWENGGFGKLKTRVAGTRVSCNNFLEKSGQESKQKQESNGQPSGFWFSFSDNRNCSFLIQNRGNGRGEGLMSLIIRVNHPALSQCVLDLQKNNPLNTCSDL